jgi:hypothetical protein
MKKTLTLLMLIVCTSTYSQTNQSSSIDCNELKRKIESSNILPEIVDCPRCPNVKSVSLYTYKKKDYIVATYSNYRTYLLCNVQPEERILLTYNSTNDASGIRMMERIIKEIASKNRCNCTTD